MHIHERYKQYYSFSCKKFSCPGQMEMSLLSSYQSELLKDFEELSMNFYNKMCRSKEVVST